MKRLPRAIQFTQLAMLPISVMRLTPDSKAQITGSKLAISRAGLPAHSSPGHTFRLNHSYIGHVALFGSRMATPITMALEEILNQ